MRGGKRIISGILAAVLPLGMAGCVLSGLLEEYTDRQLNRLSKLDGIEEIVLYRDDTLAGQDHMHLHNGVELHFSDGRFLRVDGMGDDLKGHAFTLEQIGRHKVLAGSYQKNNDTYPIEDFAQNENGRWQRKPWGPQKQKSEDPSGRILYEDAFFLTTDPCGFTFLTALTGKKIQSLKDIIAHYDEIVAEIDSLQEPPISTVFSEFYYHENPDDHLLTDEQLAGARRVTFRETTRFYTEMTRYAFKVMADDTRGDYLREAELYEDLRAQSGVANVTRVNQPYSFEEQYVYDIEMLGGSTFRLALTAARRRDARCVWHITRLDGDDAACHEAGWPKLAIRTYFSNDDLKAITGQESESYRDIFPRFDEIKAFIAGANE